MVYVIAEIGSTHDGSVYQACEMIRLWSSLGADAVKFQCHHGQRVENVWHPNERVKELRGDYYARTGFAGPQWADVVRECRRNHVECVVSPFSTAAVNLLMRYEAPDKWKIASGEVANRKLLSAVLKTGIPVIVSTGMCNEVELAAAVAAVDPWAVLHCVSKYPCEPSMALAGHLGVLRLDRRWGHSDHTMSNVASLTLGAIGAEVFERHVTPSRRMYGSDAAHSLEPEEFHRFTEELREQASMMSADVSRGALLNATAKVREVFWNEQP